MSQSAHRFAFIMLVILAILARAVIPAGFMPEVHNGKVAIQICHGAELATIYVDTNDHSQSTPVKKDCPYSPIAQSDTGTGEPITLSSEVIEYTQIAYGLVQETGNINYTHQPGQPRAPPIIL